MKIHRQVIKTILRFALLIFMGCTKSVVQEGPQGPRGNASVLSREFVICHDSCSLHWDSICTDPQLPITNNLLQWRKAIFDGDITQDIVDNGIVLVYCDDSTGQIWSGLPLYVNDTGNHCTFCWNFNYLIDTIIIKYERLSGESHHIGGQKFKVVVIDGLTRMTNPSLNWSNYAEVKQALKLND